MSSPRAPTLKPVLKRGALIVAANWQVVVVQFVAESTFKILLTVPILGATFLVAVVVGGDVGEVFQGTWRDVFATIWEALAGQPVALAAFLLSFSIVLLGGSALMFLVKGGTVSVLVAADRAAGPIERPPLRADAFRRASQWSIDTFRRGCATLSGRYLPLGLTLIGIYAVSGTLYVLILLSAYRLLEQTPLLLVWTMVAAVLSSALVVWITLVNLFYLLTQIIIAADDRGVRSAIAQVVRFVRADLWDVLAVFGVIVALVLLTTAVSLVATTGLGLIAFVPLAGLAAFPLQAAAWLLRGVVFQYLGLAALGAYIDLYRRSSVAPGRPAPASVLRPMPDGSKVSLTA